MNVLPRIHLRGQDWILDLKLSEIRKSDCPHERLDLDDLKEVELNFLIEAVGIKFWMSNLSY